MKAIIITRKETLPAGWIFDVVIEGTTYNVTLDERYYLDVTDERLSPEELIERVFLFLLKREPKEAILRTFNVSVIKQYFKDFEKVMRSGEAGYC